MDPEKTQTQVYNQNIEPILVYKKWNLDHNMLCTTSENSIKDVKAPG